ncbi:MAG: hypothetical protein U0W24_09425 [Bacteroidales bacterium]
MKKAIISLIFLVFFLFQGYAQNDTIESPYDATDTLDENFGLFTNDEILNISLRFDITNYRKKKPKDEYMNAVLTYHINEKDSVNHEIRLKSRGEFRNDYCSFPPLRLNFKKAGFEKEDLKKIGKIKVVTHCVSGNENYLLKEYLIYKLFNVLTDNSFRVRLIRITYIDTNKKKKPIQSFAFFIEPIEMLADRTKTFPVESTKLGMVNIAPEFMDRMAIFCYMIGNTDWSVPNQHNCKILSRPNSDDPTRGMIVPYDFDYSGLVNAHYAIPYEGLGLASVRERRYLGMCRTEQEFKNAVKEFLEKKEEFYRVINEFQYLNEKNKKDMIDYLDSFFSKFDKSNTIVYTLLNECRKL